MSPKARRYARILLVATILVGAGPWLAPHFLGAEHYRPKLRAALSRALGRPVNFGEISVHLLPRPGFTVQNVVVGELPEFGTEPFGVAASLYCDLRWRSLWQSRLSVASITLEDASLNLVRDSRGQWNIEGLLTRSSAGPQKTELSESGQAPSGLDILVRSARLNFKIGEDKKPFAITDVTGSVHVDLASKTVRFRLGGSPVRTDIPYPSPGAVEFAGSLSPGNSPDGKLDATLKTQQTLLYDWIPLVAGVNPGVYGVLDSEIRLTGSLRDPQFDGQARFSQLHRWEKLPPASSLPCTLHFRGDFNRDSGQLRIASLDLAFASSQIHLAGTVRGIPAALELDLVMGIERSRLGDLADLYQHLTGGQLKEEIAGDVDGMLTVQGAWANPRYGGFVSGREISLQTSAGSFPVSEIALRIEGDRARLAPVRVLLAPHVEAVVEGQVERLPQLGRKPLRLGLPRYQLVLRADSVPLHDLVRFARGIGLDDARNLDAQGMTSLMLRLAGTAWPLSRPQVSAHATVERARLLLPGLTEPINIPKAEVSVQGPKILVSPFVAVLGTSVFTGSISHYGPRKQPWDFAISADHLDLGQGATWLDVLGEQAPAALLQNLPGIGSLLQRRQAASGLFERLDAQGRFSTASLTYRNVVLHHFAAVLRIQDRALRMATAAFRAGGGRGTAQGLLDLGKQPVQMYATFSLAGAGVGALAPVLPAELRQARGPYSANVQLETRGLTRSEILANLRGSATLDLGKVALGRFDLLKTLAKETGQAVMASSGGSSIIESGKAKFSLSGGSIRMDSGVLNLDSVQLGLKGVYRPNGQIRLNIQCGLNRSKPPWRLAGRADARGPRYAELEFAGTFDHLMRIPRPSLPKRER